jgi:formate dehydrogenase maturation protein FdhE
MPRMIDGKELSEEEARQWKHINPFARCPECGSTAVEFDKFALHNEETLRCSECSCCFSMYEALPAGTVPQ